MSVWSDSPTVNALNDLCYEINRTSLDCLNQQLLIGLYIFLIQPFSDMKDILSVQRHVRARGEIIILNGNEMYNVPIATLLKTFLHYSGGHLRYSHGMDSCVTVWILPLCLVLTPILNMPVVYRARLILDRPMHIANRVTINGNYGFTLYSCFWAPLSTCSYVLSPLPGSSVSVQNHKVEIYREYLLCQYRVTWWKSELNKRRASAMQTIQEQCRYFLLQTIFNVLSGKFDRQNAFESNDKFNILCTRLFIF